MPMNESPLGDWTGIRPAAVLLLCGILLGSAGEPPSKHELPRYVARDLLAPLPTDASAPDRLRCASGPRGRRLQTEHFLLMHTTDERTARRLGARLEAVYRANIHFLEELRLEPQRPTSKLEVLVFRSYDEFRGYLKKAGSSDETILGLFEPTNNRTVFFDLATHPQVAALRRKLEDLRNAGWARRRPVLRTLRQRSAALNAKVIQHEAAHQVQFNIGVLSPDHQVPAWLAEGLAQLFELPFESAGITDLSVINRYRLNEFRELHANQPDMRSALCTLIGSDQKLSDGADYSLAWALTDYLYRCHREEFAGYLRQIAAKGCNPGDFEEHFGVVDERFTLQFQAYIRDLLQRYPTDQE
ncbi:MAG: DUF1570 domain-containing protein [Planctomycetota bacterium]